LTIDPSGGTATVNSDYTDFTGTTVTIADGSGTGTATVTVLPDALFENSESVKPPYLHLVIQPIIINTAMATASIADDDNGAGTVTAILSQLVQGNETGPVSIQYRVSTCVVNNTHGPITLALIQLVEQQLWSVITLTYRLNYYSSGWCEHWHD
jgi:hypothetical protein